MGNRKKVSQSQGTFRVKTLSLLKPYIFFRKTTRLAERAVTMELSVAGSYAMGKIENDKNLPLWDMGKAI